jgi:hypothetical protein
MGCSTTCKWLPQQAMWVLLVKAQEQAHSRLKGRSLTAEGHTMTMHSQQQRAKLLGLPHRG